MKIFLMGLKLYSEIYQNFQILENFLGHRVWHQKLCLLTKFEPMSPFQSRQIASDISSSTSPKIMEK